MKRFVVSDEQTLADVTRTLAIPDAWLAEGRLFVGPLRVKNKTHALRPGDVVRIEEPSSDREKGPPRALTILYEDDALCVVDKPAGMSTVGDLKSESDSLRGAVARHRHVPIESVHPTSRLDRDVSGVVTFALRPEAGESLRLARERGAYARMYLALAMPTKVGKSLADAFVWKAPIGRAKNPRLRQANGRDATPAETRGQVVSRTPHGVLLALFPQTGRTHQLRVHAADAGVPLDGDRDYGGRVRTVDAEGRVSTLNRIALHAAIVRFPYGGGALTLRAEVPEALRTLWKSLGGPVEAWNSALACFPS